MHLEAVPTASLDARLVADLRLIANASFAPLEGFMSETDYHSVLDSCRLANGNLFPLPIVLPVDEAVALEALKEGSLLLQDEFRTPLALCQVIEIYDPDLEKECEQALGTQDPRHPFVPVILNRKGKKYVAGPIQSLPALALLDKQDRASSPAGVKALLQQKSAGPIVAFQTRNPLHGTHIALILHCLKLVGPDAQLLLHPVIGPTQNEDVSAFARKKCYEAILDRFEPYPVTLAYLPLTMRMAGPREALLHALIRKNHGATHFIVGKDQAGPSTKSEQGTPFYSPNAAAEFVKRHESELGITILAVPELFVFVEELQCFIPEKSLQPGMTPRHVSGSELRRRLQNQEMIPHWFSSPDVLEILTKYYEHKNGVCIYLTGLSGAGKTTLAQLLKCRIEEEDPLSREVVLLDGDYIRNYLSSELGFSKKDRSLNVQRIGFAAGLVVGSGGIAICANIAPYEADRLANRQLISKKGNYFEVFVDTSLEVCEQRDVKGLYRLARQGLLSEFVGIGSSYEIPTSADLVVDGNGDLEEIIDRILKELRKRNILLAKHSKD